MSMTVQGTSSVPFPEKLPQTVQPIKTVKTDTPQVVKKGTGELFAEGLTSSNKAEQKAEGGFTPLNLAFNAKDKIKSLTKQGKEALQNAITPDKFVSAAKRMIKSGNTAGATKIVDSLLAKEPDNAAALELKGRILMEEGKTDEAKKLFHDALRANPDMALAYGNIGVIHGNEGDHETAELYFDQAVKIAEDENNDELKAHAYAMRGEARSNLGNIDGALADINKAIEYAQGDKKQALLESKVEFAKANQKYDALAETYGQLAKLNPDKSAEYAKLQNEALRAHGNDLLEADKLDEAQAAYEKVLESDPNNYKALNNLGIIEGTRGNSQAALDLFNKAVDAMEKSGEDPVGLPYKNRGIEQEKLGNTLDAARDYGRAAELGDQGGMEKLLDLQEANPEDAEINRIVAETYVALGQPEKAADYFEKMQAADPKAEIEFGKSSRADEIVSVAAASGQDVTVKTGQMTFGTSAQETLDARLSKIEGLEYELKLGDNYLLEMVIKNGDKLSPEAQAQLKEVLNDKVLDTPPEVVELKKPVYLDKNSTAEEFDSVLTSGKPDIRIKTGLSTVFGDDTDYKMKRALEAIPNLDYQFTVDENYAMVIQINNAQELSASDRMILQTILQEAQKEV